MSWLLLIAMTLVVFLNRYLLLEPNLPIKIPTWFQASLQYSAPCLLIAIATPIVFTQAEGVFRMSLWNPYFVASIITIILAYQMKNTLMAIILSVVSFYVLSIMMACVSCTR